MNSAAMALIATLRLFVLSLVVAIPPVMPSLHAAPEFLGNILRSTSVTDNSTTPPSKVMTMNADSDFTRYWDQFTPENAGKWGNTEYSRDVMGLTAFSDMMSFATANSVATKGHALIWFNKDPSWIGTLSAADQLAEVREWIDLFSAAYPNLQYLDVVNEPLHGKPAYAGALGGDGATGWDWVVWAFNYTRPRMPNTKLILNDYEVENSQNQGVRYMQIIKHVKATGNLDGIGFQGHFIEGSDRKQIQAMLLQFAAFGLDLYLTELDIKNASDANQLSQMKSLIPVVWSNPKMKGITLWGYKQGAHWQPDAYLLRSDNTERPALTWLMDYKKGVIAKDTTAPTAPTNFQVSHSASHNTLTWTGATDNVGIGAYAIHRDGRLLSAVPGNITGFEDRGSWPDTSGTKNGNDVAYQVIAYDAEHNSAASPVVTVSSSVQPAYSQDSSGLLVLEAEARFATATGNGTTYGFSSFNVNNTAWSELADASASGNNTMAANATTGVNAQGWQQAPFLSYAAHFNRTGDHHVWLRVRTTGGATADDAVLIALDKVPLRLWDTGATSTWTWKKIPLPLPVPTTGYHEFQLYMGEDGLVVDKIVITSDPAYTPTGLGPSASES